MATSGAGVLQFSYLGMGDPTTATGMELDIIAAVVIGGASLTGGRGTFSSVLDHYEDVPSHLAEKIIETHKKEHHGDGH